MIYFEKKYMLEILCLGIFVLFQAGICSARTINIPGEYATIQAGIDAAVDGDIVLVAEGTYSGTGNKDLDFKGKAITVRSAGGPKKTIIDCQGLGRGVFFHNGEKLTSRFSGFTIKNGRVLDNLSYWGGKGGGIHCYQANPLISNCIISQCRADGFGGGGIFLDESEARVESTIIEYGSAETCGGGILIDGGAPVIYNSIIRGNRTRGYSSGGGVCIIRSNPTLSHCTITQNEANVNYVSGGSYSVTNSGGISFREGSTGILESSIISYNRAQERGGVGSWNAAPTVTNCLITGNEATVDGGGGIGLYSDSNATVSRCTIKNNNAEKYGGGISIWNETASSTGPIFADCIVEDNVVSGLGGAGGGLNAFNSSLKLSRCILRNNTSPTRAGISLNGNSGASTLSILVNDLIYNNNSTGFGGGISCSSGAGASITNCTITANRTGASSGGLFIDGAIVSVANSIFWGNIPVDSLSNGAEITYSVVEGGYAGTGNINNDPLFAGTTDFHLSVASPCLNSGNSLGSNVPVDDLGRNIRSDGSVDMGSYEFPYTVGGPGVSGGVGADITFGVPASGDDGLPWIVPLLLSNP